MVARVLDHVGIKNGSARGKPDGGSPGADLSGCSNKTRKLMADNTLLMLLDDVRGKTLSVLQDLDETQARWAPPGLQNSCLWHAGHAYVVTEFLTMRALDRDATMPENWLKMFSWESNPAHTSPESWPPLSEVTSALKSQQERFRAIITSLTPEQLDAPEPGNPSKPVRYGILHGLHDEARHSGEISLLRKLMAKTFTK